MTSIYTQEEKSYWYNYIFDVMAKTSKCSFSIGVNPPRQSLKKIEKATRFVWDLLREIEALEEENKALKISQSF